MLKLITWLMSLAVPGPEAQTPLQLDGLAACTVPVQPLVTVQPHLSAERHRLYPAIRMVIRGVYQHFITEDACQELIFIQRSLGVVGYRPHVTSTNLFDVALAEPRLLPAVVRVRQLIWDCVEEHFDKPCQVFVEHTSLISWHAGASIGWHHDANRSYLSQRHFSAVLYLNTQGQDFSGGTFCFQAGPQPTRISPAAGTLLVYTGDEQSVHRVEEVTAGERVTLTMWFTLDQAFQEDRKVLAQLSDVARTCHHGCGLPETMYQQEIDGVDIRVLQLQQLGLQLECLHQHDSDTQQQKTQLWQLKVTVAPIEEATDTPMPGGKCIRDPAVLSPLVSQFSSLQEAVLTINFLLWRMSLKSKPASPATSQSGSSSHWSTWTPGCVYNRGRVTTGAEDALSFVPERTLSSHHHVSAGKQLRQYCLCCDSNNKVLQASQMLQEYLAVAGLHLGQLLPRWREHEALVATLVLE